MTVQYEPMKLIDKIKQNNYSYTHSYTQKVTEANADVEKFQGKMTTLQKNVKKLKRYTAGGISKNLLESRIEDLVKSYNQVMNNASDIKDQDMQKQISKLEKLFTDNKKELKKIGIEKVDGKYKLNTNTFDDADDKAINALFTGRNSFIGQADKIMRKLEETTDDAHYDTTTYQLSRTQKYEAADMELAAYMTLAGQTTSAMKAVSSGDLSDSTVQESMKIYLGYFAESVYHAGNTNEYVDRLNKLCLDQKDQLAKIGLTFDSEQKTMSFDSDIDMTTTDFQDAYNGLFGADASFGNEVSEYSKVIFNDLVKPDKIGVSIIDAQA